MEFVYTDGRDGDFKLLCLELDKYLNHAAGGEENRSQYIPHNQLEDIHHVIISYDASRPVGCAGFREYSPGCAEVKRVFVREEYRGRGIAGKLLEGLEEAAKEAGYHCLVLESGEPLASAMALYRKTGFQVIPNYGPYEGMPESVCMKKEIV